ncbi:hypothetical protein D3C80_168040 [compost metagenome]
MKQPMQPLIRDDHGRCRFKENTIVSHLLHHGGINLNDLVTHSFLIEDWEQFHQLTGYDLSGFGELTYVSDETYGVAARMADDGLTEEQARIAYLEEELQALKRALQAPVARLYSQQLASLLASEEGTKTDGLKGELEAIKQGLQEPVARLYGKQLEAVLSAGQGAGHD